jgi:hypothetical protein
VVAGLRPDRFQVPYQPDFDDDGPLRWAAAPILDQVAGELEGTGVVLLLCAGQGVRTKVRTGGGSSLSTRHQDERRPHQTCEQ